MLFSRDKAQTRRALNMLNSTLEDATTFRRDLGFAMLLGQVTSSLNERTRSEAAPTQPEETVPEPAPAEQNFESMSDEELDAFIEQQESGTANFESMSDEELDAFIEQQSASSSGEYGTQLNAFYEQQDPEFLDLLKRVEKQESGGNPNAVSSAGAIGLMQVMPDTAPEAAKLAGVPFDENAYRRDPSYQRLIGAAYLAEMLRQFDGNKALALAAYNAGPGRVRQALRSGDRWFANLPAETRNYVQVLL